jgi:hypothetical protein
MPGGVPKTPKAPNPGINNAGKPGGMVIRPMYGVFVRDSVAKFRTDLSATLNDTKKAIAKGNAIVRKNPKAPEVFGDGKLQGSELKSAKAAVKELEKAIKALKPVFQDFTLPTAPPTLPAGAGSGVIRPMYGVTLRDDLTKFREEAEANLRAINGAINSGELKGPAKTEAQKAVKFLKTAIQDLGPLFVV